jgi:hypothetical protein
MMRTPKKEMALPVLIWWIGMATAIRGEAQPVPINESSASQKEVLQKRGESSADEAPRNVLSAAEWKRVDAAVDRALTWLASRQRDDGSFPTVPNGQPGVTGLCAMAFVSHGRSPSDAQFGSRLERIVDYIIACQKENGLIALLGDDRAELSRNVSHSVGVCSAYNHAIGSLTLSELYGMSDPKRARRMDTAIKKALSATLQMQRWPKQREVDRGGWRYIDHSDQWDSDLSITGWNLMFLRSARNAGFDVPKQAIDDAVAYIRRCYSKKHKTFEYRIENPERLSRGMAGAGILALAHAGYHKSAEAQTAGEWILKHNFQAYNSTPQELSDRDRYHYSLFNSCQGMYQLGGRYWQEFFPRVETVLLANQRPDGSWPADRNKNDAVFGNAYTTALVVMTLGAPNQLLPIFQR